MLDETTKLINANGDHARYMIVNFNCSVLQEYTFYLDFSNLLVAEWYLDLSVKMQKK